jgi:ABC-2 type transport system ATP-binding protein
VLGEIEAICNRVVVINRGRILVDDDIKNLAAAGKIVRLELARPSDLARSALAAVEGVESVELTGTTAVVRSQADIREQLAAAAVPFGLLELGGRERLEDIYLRLIGAQGAA